MYRYLDLFCIEIRNKNPDIEAPGRWITLFLALKSGYPETGVLLYFHFALNPDKENKRRWFCAKNIFYWIFLIFYIFVFVFVRKKQNQRMKIKSVLKLHRRSKMLSSAHFMLRSCLMPCLLCACLLAATVQTETLKSFIITYLAQVRLMCR